MATRPEPYLHLVDDDRVWALLARLREEGDPATLAFAWLFAQPHVTAVTVGPRRPEHLLPAVTALQRERVDLQKDTFAL
jgi:aryl-alcohol dehydrogenase-like predicted oxidoreductase